MADAIQIVAYLASAGIGALVGASVGYYASRNVAKRQLSYQAKLTVYADVVKHLQEALNTMSEVSAVMEIDAKDEAKFVENFTFLAGEMLESGSEEYVNYHAYSERMKESLQKESPTELLESMKNQAILLLARKTTEAMRNLKSRFSLLKLVRPSYDVEVALDKANSVMPEMLLDMFSKTAIQTKGLESIVVQIGMPKDRSGDVVKTLQGLMEAMKRDLDATL